MAEYVELFIDQGSDFYTTININDDNTNLPTNVYTYSVTSCLRRSLISQNVAANLVCSVTDSTNGVIQLYLDSGNTSNLHPGPYYFDVKVYNSSATFRTSKLIEGIMYVVPSITR
jgi:hypothetical protein